MSHSYMEWEPQKCQHDSLRWTEGLRQGRVISLSPDMILKTTRHPHVPQFGDGVVVV